MYGIADEPICSAAERLLQLADALQQPDVRSEARGARPDTRERTENPLVDLAGVDLSDDVVDARETEHLGQLPVELVHPLAVAQELLERRLRAGRAPCPSQSQVVQGRIDLIEVEEEVLQPQARPLAHRGGLRGLEVRVAERREIAVLAGELRQRRRDRGKAVAHEPKGVALLDERCVVGHERAGGAEMDVAAGRGRDLPEVVDVRHHIVAQLRLQLRDPAEVEGVAGLSHLRDRGVGDLDAELPFRLGKRYPQISPDESRARRRKDVGHLLRRVTVDQWVWVAKAIVGHDA